MLRDMRAGKAGNLGSLACSGYLGLITRCARANPQIAGENVFSERYLIDPGRKQKFLARVPCPSRHRHVGKIKLTSA